MSVPLVTIGASLGGLAAVSTVLRGLPPRLEAALALVQHRRPDADSPLAMLLSKHSALPVREPEVDERWAPGIVYLAPPAYHMLVEGDHFAFSIDAPVAFARPSIDVLFESAADVFGRSLLGVILSGANDDGARGAAAIERADGVVLIQDPETAEHATMPRAAYAAAPAAVVASIDGIAAILASLGESPTLQAPGNPHG